VLCQVLALAPAAPRLITPWTSFGHIIEESLEVKLPTIWKDQTQSRAEAERRERLEERRVEEKEYKKKEDADA
jgi:hypothetical protein